MRRSSTSDDVKQLGEYLLEINTRHERLVENGIRHNPGEHGWRRSATSTRPDAVALTVSSSMDAADQVCPDRGM